MRVVLTGGGTGGHAYPALSIAAALQTEYPDCELLYLGGKNSLEERLAASDGIPFVGLTSRKLTKLFSVSGLHTMASLVRGIGEAIRVLSRFKPDIVIGTGGYAAAAVVRAQSLRSGKTIILEADVIAGRTNRWLSKFASKICVAFQGAVSQFPEDRVVVTGLPIRADLWNLPDKEEARTSLGLEPDVFTLLVLGGSQGALRLNQVVADSIPMLRRLPVQVLHQTGPKNFDEAENARKSLGWERYHVKPYFEDMRPVYGSSDLVLSRCGSSTLAEITGVGLPVILVPYPHSHADHQSYNAEFIAASGAGIFINEAELNADLLVNTIERLMTSPIELEEMAKASRRLGKPDAARTIALIAGKMIES